MPAPALIGSRNDLIPDDDVTEQLGPVAPGAVSSVQVEVAWQLYQPFPSHTTTQFLPACSKGVKSYSRYPTRFS